MLKKSLLIGTIFAGSLLSFSGWADSYKPLTYHDAHFHLYNYVQRGTSLKDLETIMIEAGVSRTTVFGIPLQQRWHGREDKKQGDELLEGRLNTDSYGGDERHPYYYLQSDEPLYYFSATDLLIGDILDNRENYKREQEQDGDEDGDAEQLTPFKKDTMNRILDGMITGFNPTDMRALDHIDSVMAAYPGIFKGVGEFTIHKEFVSSKVAGGAATLTDPALLETLVGVAKRGLITILHNDIGTADSREHFHQSNYGNLKNLLDDLKAKLVPPQDNNAPADGAEDDAVHDNNEAGDIAVDVTTTPPVIWAHTGIGRYVNPAASHADQLRSLLEAHPNLYMDISWDYVGYKILNQALETEELAGKWLNLFIDHSDRFLLGSDSLSPDTTTKDENKENTYYQTFLEGQIARKLNHDFNEESPIRRHIKQYFANEASDVARSSHAKNIHMYDWLFHLLPAAKGESVSAGNPTKDEVRSTSCKKDNIAATRGAKKYRIASNCIAWANYERIFNSSNYRTLRRNHTKDLATKHAQKNGFTVDSYETDELAKFDRNNPEDQKAVF
ncbi:MAG: hypothetical protein MI743_08040 [Sneathiellales bacterium]|nr:hypothetical protein [Sneathiellales bacterium]